MKTRFLILTSLIVSIVCVQTYGQNSSEASPYPLLAKAESLFDQKQPEKAKLLAIEKLAEAKLSPKSRAEAQYVLGRSIFNLDGPAESLNDLIESEKQARAINDDGLLVKILVTIGAAYIILEDTNNAETYLNEGLALSIRLNDDLNIVKQQTNLANLHTLNEDYILALKYNDEAEKKLKTLKGYDKERGINAYSKANNLLYLYIENNKKEYLIEAKLKFEEAIKYFQEIKDTESESHARNAYGGCLLYFNDTRNAKEQINESIRLGVLSNDSSALLNAYYTLVSVCEMQGDKKGRHEAKKNMLAYLKAVGTTQDEAFILEEFNLANFKNKNAKLDGLFILEDLTYENHLLRGKNNLMLYSLCAAIFLLGIYFWYSRQNQRLMKSAIDELVKTRDIEFIKAKLQGQDKERQQLARQIHDGLGGFLISSKYNLEAALRELPPSDEKTVAKIEENIRLQERSYAELRKIAYALEQEDRPWWESLQQLCTQFSKDRGVEILFLPYNLDESIGGKLGEEVRFIAQELLTNAVKHADATKIALEVSLIDGEIDIVIEDNGKGFDPENQRKGVGMRSISQRVEDLNGQLSFEKSKKGGTVAFVYIPLKNRDAINTSGHYDIKHKD